MVRTLYLFLVLRLYVDGVASRVVSDNPCDSVMHWSQMLLYYYVHVGLYTRVGTRGASHCLGRLGTSLPSDYRYNSMLYL